MKVSGQLLELTKIMEQSDYIDEDDGVVEDSMMEVISLKMPLSLRGQRMDKAISQLLPQHSRSRIQGWIEKGFILKNEARISSKDAVLGYEVLLIQVPQNPEDSAFSPENIDLDVLFEDEFIAVINKPAGLVVHPAPGNWSGTLLNGILHRFPECALVPRAGIVHRLDKDTSGLLVVAKTLESQTDLVRQLQARTVHRHYLSLVWGKFPPMKVIRESIGRDPKDRLKMAVVSNHTGKPAVTHVKRLEQIEYEGASLALLACKLETGRTHQIRVHLEYAGFPLFNDSVYRRRIPQNPFEQIKKTMAEEFSLPGQALHAAVLGLKHPKTQEEMLWKIEPPKSLQLVLSYLGLKDTAWQKIFTESFQ